MKNTRRQFLQMAAGTTALSAMSRIAHAQAYPSRPVKLILGFPAGGPADVMARFTAQLLTERFRQQFIVENKVGAASNIAAEAVIRATPDGYTLLWATISNASNTTLFDNLTFDFMRDTAPVAGVNSAGGVLLVNPTFSTKSLPEFISFAKANPGKIAYASGGIGSISHLYGELFKSLAAVDLLHIPYRGAGPAVIDVLAGQVPAIFDSVTTATGYIKAERLRPLAVTTATRMDGLSSIPAIAEFVPGYEAIGWNGVVAPKDTPRAIIDNLNGAINASLADPRMTARLAELSAVSLSGTPAEFGKFVVNETEKWSKVIRAAHIKVE